MNMTAPSLTFRDIAPDLADQFLVKTAQLRKVMNAWKKPGTAVFMTEYRTAKPVLAESLVEAEPVTSAAVVKSAVAEMETTPQEVFPYAAADYISFLSTRGAFSTKFLNAFREVLIDISMLNAPEVMRDALVLKGENLEVEFDLAMEISRTKEFTEDLLNDVLNGQREAPVMLRSSEIRNMKQASENLRRGKQRKRNFEK